MSDENKDLDKDKDADPSKDNKGKEGEFKVSKQDWDNMLSSNKTLQDDNVELKRKQMGLKDQLNKKGSKGAEENTIESLTKDLTAEKGNSKLLQEQLDFEKVSNAIGTRLQFQDENTKKYFLSNSKEMKNVLIEANGVPNSFTIDKVVEEGNRDFANFLKGDKKISGGGKFGGGDGNQSPGSGDDKWKLPEFKDGEDFIKQVRQRTLKMPV